MIPKSPLRIDQDHELDNPLHDHLSYALQSRPLFPLFGYSLENDIHTLKYFSNASSIVAERFCLESSLIASSFFCTFLFVIEIE